MKKVLKLLLLVGCVVSSGYAKNEDSAQEIKYEGIVATVNGDIITAKDLDEQVKIAVLASGLKDNNIMRLEILKNMISEKLKWSLLKKLSGKDKWIKEEDVNEAFAQIARQNNMDPIAFSKLLKSKNINVDLFKRSMETNLSWIEYIKLRYRRSVNISEKAVAQTLKRIKEAKQKESFLVSRMFFPVMDLNESNSVSKKVSNIRRMLSQGSDFAQLARKFSKSPDAKNGGDLGWIYDGQLSSEEYSALENMKPMEVKVIKNNRGFFILQLRDKRDAGKDYITHLRFVQVGVPRPEYAGGQDTKSLLNQLKQRYPTASAFIKQARAIGCFVSDPVESVLEAMTPDVRDAVKYCKSNGLSSIISNDKAFFVFCILGRAEEKIPEPSAEVIKNQKINERFGIFSDKELYELKKKADIKLDSKYGKVADFISQL